jgi:hypothetical protein
MAISFFVDPERRLVELTVSGEFETEEIIAAVDSIASHPDFQPGFDLYSDNRGVTRPITTKQVLRLTAHLAHATPEFAGMRVAFVTGSVVSFGMMRMMASFAEEAAVTVRAFDNDAVARAWLAREADE